MDFAGILAFISKKRRLIHQIKREDHLDIVWMVFLSRDDADPAWISCFSLTIW